MTTNTRKDATVRDTKRHIAHTPADRHKELQREAKRQQRHKQRLQMDTKWLQGDKKTTTKIDNQTAGSKKQLQRNKTDYKHKIKGLQWDRFRIVFLNKS